MNSIRRELLASLILGLFILIGLLGSALYFYIRGALYRQYDHDLIATVRTFAMMTELELEGTYGFEFLETPLADFQDIPLPSYFQVWDEAGNSLARSPSLRENDLTRVPVVLGKPRTFNEPLPDGRAGRTVVLFFAPRIENVEDAPPYDLAPPGKQLILAIARSAEELQSTLQVLLTGILAAGAFLLISTGFLVHWAVSRGLKPLGRVVASVEEIDGAHLSHRLPVDQIPREMLPVGLRLNELLDRLEIAFQRERRFTSNVAHELRTPIAELRSLAEVGLRCLDQSESDLKMHFEDTLKIALQMESLVASLLSLARSEVGQLKLNWQSTDVSELMANTWKAYEADACQRKLEISQSIAPGLQVETDPTLLRAMLSNILSNAVTYTPANGKINLSLAQSNGEVLCVVGNQNDQMTRENMDHLFEPFWRKDEARTDLHHSGVGLSLVDSFGKLLGMKVEPDLPSADWFSIKLRMPRHHRQTVTRE